MASTGFSVPVLAAAPAAPVERKAPSAAYLSGFQETPLHTTAGTAEKVAVTQALTPEAIAWAAGRGISISTLERFGARSGTAFFPTLGRRSEAIFFPYFDQGEMVNWKAAAFPDKGFVSQKNGKLCLFNIDRVIRSPILYITEGEWDACAMVEAGFGVDQVVAVPGAQQTKEGSSSRGYAYIEEALARGLSEVKKVVYVGDADGPGLILRQDLMRIFGPARYHYLDWPAGIKDANDFLKAYGPDALHDYVLKRTREWPVAGLYFMSELPEPPPLTLWKPGFPEWENKVHIAPQTLSVVSGHPGSGKTQVMIQIMTRICQQYDIRAAVASFETRPKPHHRRSIRQVIHGQREATLTPEQIAYADSWINEHFLWIQQADQKPTFEWLLDVAEVAVVRHGARFIQIDPWNKLEHNCPTDISKTDYVGRCLDAALDFARDMNAHVQIIAHPSKMDSRRRGQPPELEDISDSKNWDNRVDQGFVVHRPRFFDESGNRVTDAHFYVRKSRYEELGYPCKLNIRFDLDRGIFVSTDYENGGGL